jgi:PAS domain S-box-containing protein
LVFENSTLGIMLLDHDQHFLATNRALQTMIGYTAQELQKLSPIDLVAEEERKATSRRLAEVRAGERNAAVLSGFSRSGSSRGSRGARGGQRSGDAEQTAL